MRIGGNHRAGSFRTWHATRFVVALIATFATLRVTATAWAADGSAKSAAPATKPALKLFKIGDMIEFKNGDAWEHGAIFSTRGDWYLIQHESRRTDKEWVEPWRVRKAGSADDRIGVTGSYGIVRGGEGPPRPDPGEAPRPGERIEDALKRQAREQSEAQTPVTKTSRDHLLEVALGANATAPLPADPELKPARPVSIQPIILSGATVAFGEREQNLLFSGGDAAIAAVSHVVGEALRVERVDLSGRSLNTVLMPAALSCVDLSQDGKLLLTQNVPEGLEGPERLDAWNIEGASPRHLMSFKPYDELTGGGRGIARARFLPGDHIATLNSEGRLVVWDYKANAVWGATTERGRRFFLSPGRKYIAILAGPSALILDALAGKTLKSVGGLPFGRKDGAQGEITLCFKPDGKELAVGARGYLSTHDLSSGAKARELYPAISQEVPIFGQASLSYCSEGYVLAPGDYVKGEQLLVGLKQQIVVWRYMPDKFHGLGPNGIFNGRYWYTAPPPLGSKGKPTLLSVLLPDDAVRTALSKVNFDNQMAVHPGVSVSLEADLPDDIKEKVAAALKDALQKNGLTVADGQEIKLVAATEQGKGKEMRYVPAMFAHLPGNVPNTTKITVNELIYRLSFVGPGGQKLWEHESVQQPPAGIRQKKDQSVEDAVAEAMRPSEGFFTSTMIPRLVPNQSVSKALGMSQWTARGPVIAPE